MSVVASANRVLHDKVLVAVAAGVERLREGERGKREDR
jgi:hypothetical protein